MPPEPPATAPTSLRQRRRAAAVREILGAAEQQITDRGPSALSLRAVARSLGMTVQALYHYFPNRDALVTALITKAYDDLADAVQAAMAEPDPAGEGERGDAGAAGEGPALPRFVVAAEAYRRWAIDHPERFQLLYGAPLRDYEAPVEGPTTQALRRMSELFAAELFGRYTTAQLAAAETPELSAGLRDFADQPPRESMQVLPAPAMALFLSAWGHLHGLVVLEVFGHTAFLGEHRAEIFRTAMRNLHDDLHRRVPAAGAAPGGRRK
ncbi:TetR/AcrR family transcriptional regulator [Streptomyces sp. Z26]|uniref:TetR/AcrR family transcriptional regulator n=1 Tax=Streptomyces sp. Z26 TaxID=2500177 RepID=UPI000EF169E1|nr:TetR/AcrR family transcriptional regulator [Streptomyces sp. Z26]RLL68637.1 TetR/AcrR family transcriptional regulator [Streptomyces sp. Z26]